MEEASELTQACNHFKRKRMHCRRKLIKELVHVHFMAKILKIGLDISESEWEDTITQEIKRVKIKQEEDDINATNDD
ncbi:MAG: hypothetical protein ACOC2U_02375 [bacterium]